jgi:diguanylate cyclase (GGDEF)-like protein
MSGVRLSSYPIFLLLVLGALRFGVAGATLLTVQVAAIVTAAAVGGTGPIAALNSGFGWQIGQAQILVVVVFLISFVTAAAVAERRRAEALIEGQRVAAAERAATNERLTAFAREIARTLEADATFHRIVQAAATVVDADIVQLSVADDTAAGRHFVRAAIGAPAAIGQPIEVGDGIAGSVIRNGVAVAHELCDPSDHGRALVHAMPPEPLAFACAPVMRDGVVIATLGVGRLDLQLPFTATETAALGVMADLSAQAIANVMEFSRADERSIRDELTGLPNRRYFNLALEQLAALRARQTPEARPVVSAILIDVDHFGAVNNERGHATGDVVLAALGALLATRLRRADIVARYGGEEFVAVLPGTPRAEAARLADDLRRQFAALVLTGTDGQPIRCTLSAGVAAVPAGEESTAELIGTADVALIMAKRAGRNQVIAA